MPVEGPASAIARANQAVRHGDLAAALANAETAWAQASAPAHPEHLASGLRLAMQLFRAGQLSAMVELSLTLLPTLREQGPATDHSDLLRATTMAACETGQLDLALPCAQEAHRVASQLNDDARLALATDAMGCVLERSGDPWQARRLMQEAVKLARQSANRNALGRTLNNLSATLIGMHYLLRDAESADQALQPLRDAQPLLEEALAMTGQEDEPLVQVYCGGNLGEVLVHLGQWPQAREQLELALSRARALGLLPAVWRISCSIGELLLQEGQPAPASLLLHEALQGAQQMGATTTCLRIHHALWRCAAAQGRSDEALQHLQQFVRLDRARSLNQMRSLSDLFVTRVEAELARKEAQQLRHRASALEQDTRRDGLTGMGNRREIEARWPALAAQARAEQAPLSMVMLDVDQFKAVNDRFGHAVGDAVLVRLAELLRAHTRGDDLLVRMGGDECLLVMCQASAAQAQATCERLRRHIAAHDWPGLFPGLSVTVSMGLASAPPYDYDFETLALNADRALYQAKSAGRNRLVCADPLASQAGLGDTAHFDAGRAPD